MADATESENIEPPGMTASHARPSSRLSRRTGAIVCTLLLACGLALGFAVGRIAKWNPPRSSHIWSSERCTKLKPGPWGELEYVPMAIAAPEELLPVRAMEEATTHWFFRDYSSDDLLKLLNSLDLPASQCDQLLSPDSLHILPNGIDLTPPRDLILALPPKARLEFYKRLARFPENASQLVFIPSNSVEDRFRENRVSDETVALFKKLSCPYGDYLVLSGLPCLLSSIPNYEEKAHFVKALTRQKTLLLRLHLTPESDINALVSYWGKAVWNTDVKAMLESLAHVPGGTWVDMVEVLPPFPTALLYTFPLPDNPLNGTPVRRDCHWTSFNFFRDPPDAQFSDPAYVLDKLKLNYFPVGSDPRYGDIVLFTKPDGSIIHSAVFLADNIVYTKNGDTPIHPWMLSTVSDLIQQYSFHVAPGEQLTVSFYRNKYY
jgi:hypothetical protein